MTDDIDRSHHDHENAEAGPHKLPDPPSRLLKDGTTLSIKDVYLGDIGDHDKLWMPLYILRLRKSYFYELATNEQLGAAFRLWTAGWIANPAASLRAEDRYIAKVAGYDLSNQNCLQYWLQYRDLIKHGWILCSDGRMYHFDLAEIALEQAEKLGKRQKSIAKARASLGKKRKKVLTQRTEQISAQKTEQTSDLKSGLDRDRDRDSRSPLTPASGGTGAAPQELSPKQKLERLRQVPRPSGGAAPPAPPAGSPTVERDPRPTSPTKAAAKVLDPEASAIRKGVYDDARVRAICGLSHQHLVDKLHDACVGSARILHGSDRLERADAIVDLLEANRAVSLELDVLPAIRDRVKRPGDRIGSWKFFCDAILGAHQNRVSGAGNGARGGASAYDPEKRPEWWHGRDEGRPPPGWGPHLRKPWKGQVIDERTGEPRRYGGRWDWEWLDAVERFQRDGHWDEWFAVELPGRPGSSCPDDICAHFGIVPQARQPNVVVPLVVGRALPTRRAYVPPPASFEAQARVMTNGSEKLMGDVPLKAPGHSLEDDAAPPF
jgi:hypothetical protein